jgi:hypothetical protein
MPLHGSYLGHTTFRLAFHTILVSLKGIWFYEAIRLTRESHHHSHTQTVHSSSTNSHSQSNDPKAHEDSHFKAASSKDSIASINNTSDLAAIVTGQQRGASAILTFDKAWEKATRPTS